MHPHHIIMAWNEISKFKGRWVVMICGLDYLRATQYRADGRRWIWAIVTKSNMRFNAISHTACRGTLSWWRHQMETFSALLALCAGNSPVTAEFPSQWPMTRSFDVFFICAWINGWVNNRVAGDLRRRRAHYDVTVMKMIWFRCVFMLEQIALHASIFDCWNMKMHILKPSLDFCVNAYIYRLLVEKSLHYYYVLKWNELIYGSCYCVIVWQKSYPVSSN